MKVDKNRVSLVEDTYAYIGNASNEANVEKFKTELQKYIKILNKVIDSAFDKLTDKELYELLSEVYGISLDEEDYLKMLSMYNNKKYTFVYRIPTTMTFNGTVNEGHGRNFDCWKQLHQIYYFAAVSDMFKFDNNKIYSKEEIKKNVSDKSIILLKQEAEAIDDNINFISEEFEQIPSLDIDINSYSDNISKFVLDNYSLFGLLLRKRFTKSIVLNDMRKMLNVITEEIQDVFSEIKSNDPDYSETARLCKEWYDTSTEKVEYQGIQKLLKPNINND